MNKNNVNSKFESIKNGKFNSADVSTVVNNTDELGTLGYGSIIIAQFGAIILSLISANHTFSFLHNKRSTDMFGAIPCTRSTLYFSHLLGGI